MITTEELERLETLQLELVSCEPNMVIEVLGIEKLEELLALLIKQETSI
ncbi:MAG: hypothetical protein QM535_03335 [Limnohabitans sp.]|nr:hypothetical protein [Limnohabitans sp.]